MLLFLQIWCRGLWNLWCLSTLPKTQRSNHHMVGCRLPKSSSFWTFSSKGCPPYSPGQLVSSLLQNPQWYCDYHGIVLSRVDGFEVIVHERYRRHPSRRTGVCGVRLVHFSNASFLRRLKSLLPQTHQQLCWWVIELGSPYGLATLGT